MKLLLHTCCAPCSVYCIEELKKDPKLTSHMAKEEDLSPNDYITYTSTPDKNISYYDSTLKKIYTLKNNQNKNH